MSLCRRATVVARRRRHAFGSIGSHRPRKSTRRTLGVAELCLEMATSYAKASLAFAARWLTARRCSGCWPTCFINCRRRGSSSTRPASRLDLGRSARGSYVAKYFSAKMSFMAADSVSWQIHGWIALTTISRSKDVRQQLATQSRNALTSHEMVIARHVLKTYG